MATQSVDRFARSELQLIAVSKTVFVSVCTPLVAIRFGTSSQLGSSNLLFGHGGGAEAVAEEERVIEEIEHGK